METKQKNLLNGLEHFKKVMDRHEITFGLTGGTLLGAFRDKEIIPWDTDVDLFVNHDVWGELCAAEWDLEKEGFVCENNLFVKPDGVVEEDYPLYYGARQESLLLHWDREIKSESNVGAVVDVHRLHITPDLGYHYIVDKSKTDEGRKRVIAMGFPPEHYIKLDNIRLHGDGYLGPSNIAAYIERRYVDWQTPITRGYNYRDERTNLALTHDWTWDPNVDKVALVNMAADILHPGQLNILKIARELGQVVVGLMTDKAMREYKREPYMCYEYRKEIVENIRGVREVVPYKVAPHGHEEVIPKFKPDYLVHGDDWKYGSAERKATRACAIELIEMVGGKYIEIPYTKGISTTMLKERIKNNDN